VDRGSAGGADGGRAWAVSTGGAVAQLGGALLFIATFIGGGAYLLGDAARPAAPRWDHGFADVASQRAQQGLPEAAEAEEEEE
jgi:hypothetical protein